LRIIEIGRHTGGPLSLRGWIDFFSKGVFDFVSVVAAAAPEDDEVEEREIDLERLEVARVFLARRFLRRGRS